MEKRHSVFVDLNEHEILSLVVPVLRTKGLLKDIPSTAEASLFDNHDLSIEFQWSVPVVYKDDWFNPSEDFKKMKE